MTTAIQRLVSIGVFALGIGAIGVFMLSISEKKRKALSSHESHRLSHQPWDMQSSHDRGNR
jgi:hypothetical protein